MESKGSCTLVTNRLILRKFEIEDCNDMFNNWANDSEVTKFLTWPVHKDINTSRAVLEEWINNYDNDDFYNWAIVLKNSNEVIGNISVVNLYKDIENAEIGYCLGRKYWHQGIMSECLDAVIDFLFYEVKVNRISSRHDSNNPNSGAVMKKCGMIYEGTLRQADRNNQGICDVCYYGILRGDYIGK